MIFYGRIVGMNSSLEKIPFATIFIGILTLLYSMYVAFDINGRFLSDVKILQLEPYGGITITHLKDFQLWRLFTFQLIHVKYMHMLYNVLSLFVLGLFVERYIRGIKFFLLWLISGSVGTLIGTLSESPPWNLGTGASQAVLGLAGFGLILALKEINLSKWIWLALGFSLIPAFALDFIYAGYPKVGHLVSALTGVLTGTIYVWFSKKSLQAVN